MTSRVLVVDDVPDLRSLVRTVLSRRSSTLEVVAEAGTGADAVACATTAQPDFVVLDLGLPDMVAAEVIAGVRRVCDARIVVLTGMDVGGEFPFDVHVEGLVRKTGDLAFLVQLLEGLASAGPRSAALALGLDPSAARAGRRFLAEQCDRWSCPDAVDPGSLIVSELVTNAVLHAHSHPQLLLVHQEGHIQITVSDDSTVSPALRRPDADDEHGRGLLLVAAFSTDWGVEPTPGGKRIWATVPCIPADLALSDG